MQTPDGLQVDDHEICSFDCIVGGLHLESNWNVWRSLKYMGGGGSTPFERWEDTFCTNTNGNNHKPVHVLLCSLTSTLGEEIKFSTEGQKKVFLKKKTSLM